jgi:tetratricopeptide (TPR) repeat protein
MTIRRLLFASAGSFAFASILTSAGLAQDSTPESYVAAGNASAKERQYDKALEAFRQALRIDPDNAAAHQGLGMTYYTLGRLAEAVDPLKTAVRLDQQNAAPHLNLAIVLASMRRADEAIAELKEAQRLSPDSPRVHNEIGNVLHNIGRFDAALGEYQEATRLDPTVPAVHHNVGLMLMRLGRFSEAVEPLNEALRLDPNYRNARYHLSNAYGRVGRYDDAVASWTKFLELEPDGKEALHGRAWNQLMAGGNGVAVAADARRYLQVAGWRDSSSPYMVLLASLGYRLSGAQSDARKVLDDAGSRLDASRWPYPVVRYMRGELDADALLSTAASNDERAEARTYLGMDALLRGRRDEARGHFTWVREYGNKRLIEYDLALAELGRM